MGLLSEPFLLGSAHHTLFLVFSAGEDAGIHGEGAGLGQVGLLIACEGRIGFVLVQFVIRQVVIDFHGVKHAEVFQLVFEVFHDVVIYELIIEC